MSELLIGTEGGIFRWTSHATGVHHEEGPPTTSFLARDANGAFALTQDGSLWEDAGQGSWRLVDDRPVAEDVWAFAGDPKLVGRLYLGVSPALLYQSDDGGRSWTPFESIKRIQGYENWTFPPPPHIPHVRSIAPDPQGTGAVFIGVEEGGVYRTDDGGQTWESLNEGLYWDIHTVRPVLSSSIIYATTGAGFHRSDDNGYHWRHITTGLDRSYTHPLVASSRSLEVLYTAAAATPPPGWKSGANVALYRSNDGGEHWMRLSEGLPEQFDTMVRQMAVDEEGGVYAASGSQLFTSGDEGETWRIAASGLPEVRALMVV